MGPHGQPLPTLSADRQAWSHSTVPVGRHFPSTVETGRPKMIHSSSRLGVEGVLLLE